MSGLDFFDTNDEEPKNQLLERSSTKKLCIDLLKAEDEEDVRKILEKKQLWNEEGAWVDYGRVPYNSRTIGNQQESSAAALAEKIINSVDAVILREAKMRNIIPEMDNAPTSIHDALEEFYNMKEGKLGNMITFRRKTISGNILLVASGSKTNPCLSIIDKGEGQAPSEFEDTFLSLSGSNKVDTPYVQGKFNMGSTGVLNFCGKYKMQLIISRKDPKLGKELVDGDLWGFTIVRRFEAKGLMKVSSYKYLTINGKIPTFVADQIRALPKNGSMVNYEESLNWGSIVKMYNYKLIGRLRSQVRTHLYSEINSLLPEIALPMQIWERRNYQGSKTPRYVYGLKIRIEENSQDLEKEYLISGDIYYKSCKLPYVLYVFKPSKKTDYVTKESIIISVNGQCHGSLSKRIIEKSGLTYLSDSIVVLVDCSQLTRALQEDLVMNSRDRLRDSEVRQDIENKIIGILKDNKSLEKLQHDRRRDKLRDKIKDNSSLINTMKEILQHTKRFTDKLAKGISIPSPLDLRETGNQIVYEGEFFPTMFALEKEFSTEHPKVGQRGRDTRVFFKTDAVNDYFSRSERPGNFNIKLLSGIIDCPDYSNNLNNGRMTLNLQIPKELSVSQKLHFAFKVLDDYNTIPFEGEFWIEVAKSKEKESSKPGNRKSSSGENGGNNLEAKLFSPPNIRQVKKPEWGEFKFDEYSALAVKASGEGSYDFFINMDNFFLLNELKPMRKDEIEIFKELYQLLMVISAFGVIDEITIVESKSNISNGKYNIEEQIKFVSRGLAPIAIPLIKSIRTEF